MHGERLSKNPMYSDVRYILLAPLPHDVARRAGHRPASSEVQNYRSDPAQAVALYMRGAAADHDQPIACIYGETGVDFDLSGDAMAKTAAFLSKVIVELA